MLTLHKNSETQQVAELVTGRKRVPVYWHPTIEETLMNSVEDLNAFNDGYFRDRFELSKEQADDIFHSLTANEVLERNQSKFFKVKRHIKQALLSEMNISDQAGEFEINFDPTVTEYSGHTLVCGGTGSGKTYWAVQMILRNLTGPKHLRRHFLVVSSEWDEDSTLKPLKADKFSEWVQGIDVSESSFKESQWSTKEQFFENEIKLRVENTPRGGVVLLDDAMDSVAPPLMRRLINRGLRVYRHLGISLLLILHSIRSGAWSSQAHNSIKYIVLFPRSQKGKITTYLNQDIGLTLKEARETVRAFSQTGRFMVVRIHSPEVIIGPKLIKVL